MVCLFLSHAENFHHILVSWGWGQMMYITAIEKATAIWTFITNEKKKKRAMFKQKPKKKNPDLSISHE